MTINYIGVNGDFDYRLAEISTSSKRSVNKAKDTEILEETISILEEMGWKGWNWFGDDKDEFAQIEVADKDEYRDLVADYKEAKRKAKNKSKNGVMP